jgi:DNA-binding transcriptional ArsR family regulator
LIVDSPEMSSVGPKQHVFASLAQIAQALGHAHRLELLEHLGQGDRHVEDLAAQASLTLANTSRHLQLLRRAALVEGRRDGKRVYYRLAGDTVVVALLAALSRVGEGNSAEIARVTASYFRARDEFEPVSRDQLLDRLRSGAATVLDVRPEDEFASGHLPNALNIPLSQLQRRLAELPADQKIVAYCRGPGASSRSRRSRCYVDTATGRGGWKMGFPNGRRPDCLFSGKPISEPSNPTDEAAS